MIYAAADKISLSRDEVERFFPYGTYFEPEISLSMWPFLLVKRLFTPRWQPPAYQPLTAQGFADLLIQLKQNPTPSNPVL